MLNEGGSVTVDSRRTIVLCKKKINLVKQSILLAMERVLG